jgi:AraC-like DNA-binding protein
MDTVGPWASYASGRHPFRKYTVSCLGAGEKSGRVAPFRRRALPTHGVVYISEGRGNYRESRTAVTVEVAAPAIIFLSPGIEHDYGPDAAGWVEHWILFEGEPFVMYEDLGLGNRASSVVSLSHPIRGVRPLFATLRSSLDSKGPRSELAASLTVQQFFLNILDAMDEVVGKSSVVRDLAQHAFVPMTVSARARQLGKTLEEMRATVLNEIGLTPHEYILELRVSRAQRLLADTDLDIGVIAARVGYSDPAYFSRLFSRRVGVSPKMFRVQQARSRFSEKIHDYPDVPL